MEFTTETVFSFLIDTDGNIIYRMKNHEYYLQLKKGKHKIVRLLGRLYSSQKILSVIRNTEEHLHRMTNSYGFCYMLLRYARAFDKLKVVVNGERAYLIPVKDVLHYGKIMHFKTTVSQDSFEKQIFLPVDILYTYEIEYNGI